MVAAAIIGSAVVGAVASSAASSSASDSQAEATAAASASAGDSNALGREELAFSKQQYADSKPARDRAAELANQVGEQQLASSKQQDTIAAEYDAYNKTTFRPLEQGIVADAQAFDTPEKRQAAADASIADVNAGFAGVQQAQGRQLGSMGINPGSARSIAAMGGMGVEQAKAGAGAAYKARQGVEQLGFARKMDAASLGRNLPSNQTAAANTAIQAGNSAVGNSAAGLAAMNSGVAGVQAGYAGAMNGAQGAGSIYGRIAANGGDSAAWGALGSTLGRFGRSYKPSGFASQGGAFPGGMDYSNTGSVYDPYSYGDG